MRQMVLASVLMFAMVGCSGSVTAKYPLSFEQAEPKLRELYPSMLMYKADGVETLNKISGHDRFVGPLVTVRRDETKNGVETIYIEEGDKVLNRMTQITLAEGKTYETCTVTVDASRSKTNVFFPSDDQPFERDLLYDISAKLVK